MPSHKVYECTGSLHSAKPRGVDVAQTAQNKKPYMNYTRAAEKSITHEYGVIVLPDCHNADFSVREKSRIPTFVVFAFATEKAV